MAKYDNWFKHYNESLEDVKFQSLWAEKDFELIAFYWAVLELVSRFETEEKRGFVKLPRSFFRQKLFINAQRLSKLLLNFQNNNFGEVKENLDGSIELFIPNWLKLQERRGGKRQAKTEQKSDFATTDLRHKTKDIRLAKPKISVSFFGEIKSELVNSWIEQLGSSEAFELELKKAHQWELANPKKVRSNKAQFLNNWINKSGKPIPIKQKPPVAKERKTLTMSELDELLESWKK